MCDQAVIIDTVRNTQSCGCTTTSRHAIGTVKDYVRTEDFQENYELLCI
jgi:hypothetical protein